MTTKVIVLSAGQLARVHIERRDEHGRFQRAETFDIPADRYAEVYLPDHAQLVIEEPSSGADTLRAAQGE